MLVDTHAHLDDSRFAADLPAVLERAAAAGVGRVITIGIDRPTSEAAVELAGRFPEVAAAVAVQPNHVAEMADGDFARITELAAGPRVVAVGETGLDRYWDRAPFDLQRQMFVRHLDLARRVGKPVVIHCRQAEADVLQVLKAAFAAGPVSGVMHSFSGDLATAEECLRLGLHISFAGMLTYKANAALREVAAAVPLDRLLVETDSPYLSPEPVRGKRNEPANVAHTAAVLARVKGVSAAELAAVTTANAVRLFGLGGPGGGG
jgi:TatD DNase family protein